MHRLGVVRPVRVFYWRARLYTPLLRVGLVSPCTIPLTLYFFRCTELLVDVVDVILEGSGINEKFLGVTLFALVPNTTEFMNAISFALNGNIALR